jgi:imidazolonepropionase-like amidohydrolase
MKKIAIFIAVITLLISCGNVESILIVKKAILIENATIISPEKEELSSNSYIVIEDGKIIFTGTKKPEIEGVFETIDASGKYIIPGLIDSHVHITGTDALTDKEEIENPQIVKNYQAQLPKSYLYFGYTTLIDLGAAKLTRLDQFKTHTVRPDLFYVGGGVVIGNGYGLTNWSDEKPNFIHQENKAHPISEQYKKENHTSKAVIKRISESGAIAVKTYYEPGFNPSQPRFPVPSIGLMDSIVNEAHKHNLIVTVHGNSLEAHQFLGKTKVDVISHGLWNWGKYRLEEDNVLPKEVTDALDLEIKNKIHYTATLQVINGLRTLTNPNFLTNPELTHVLPSDLIAHYKTNADGMYMEIFGDAPKNIIINNFNRISRQGKASLKYISDKNGMILFGTDTPSSPTYGNPPGFNGYLEMIEMKNAGISLKEILEAATINNAKAFGLEDTYGTIAKGKKANLLILNKNPLKEIEAYNSIIQIIINGKVIDRASLSARQ